MAKKAFLLLAFGGADSIESVGPFVKNVLKGRDVPSELLKKATERYRLIGGRSPLLDITKAQAEAISALIKKEGLDYRPYIGMRYWHPYIADTVKKMKEDGIEEAVAVIMAPFYTRVATGQYNAEVEKALQETGGIPKITFSRDWHISSPFIQAVAENVKNELKHFSDPKEALVIFSTHSLPWLSLEGDPYEMIVNQSADEVVKKTGPIDFTVAYQSKGAGPREWLGPTTEETIEKAKKTGKKGVVVVPFGFVADHVETLYDIDILFKGIAETSGLVFRRCPSLNTHPRLMELLAGLIIKHGEKRQ